MTEREKFEAWVVDYARKCKYRHMDNVTKTHPDDPDWYVTTWVDMARIGWQAAIESTRQQQPANPDG
jgi:hypothetical protein